MRLSRLQIKDFLSFQEAALDFQDGIFAIFGRNLDEAGAGSNGSGKSAIFDAIVWALYGRVLRDTDQDGVIRQGAKGAEAVLDFTTPHCEPGQVYRIRRTRSSKSGLEFLLIGGSDGSRDLTKSTLQLTQAAIEQVIGLDFNTFSCVAAFSADALKFASATDKEQKELLERILGLEVYGTALEKTRQERTLAEAAVKDCQREKDHVGSLINRDEEQVRALRSRQAEAQKKYAEEAARLHRDRAVALSSVDQCRTALEAVERQLMEIDQALKESPPAGSDLGVTRDAVSKARSDVSYLERAYKDACTRVARLDSDKANAAARIGKACGECGRIVTSNELSDAIAGLERKRKVEVIEVGRIVEDLGKAREELDFHQKAMTGLDTVARDREVARAEVSRIRSGLAAQQLQLSSSIVRANAEAENCAKQAERLDDGRSLDPLIQDASQAALRDRAKYAEVEAKLSKLNEDLNYLRFWEQAFGYSGIRSVLLDGVAQYLTETTNRFLRKLTFGTISVEFTTQTELKSGEKRERFEVRVANRRGAAAYGGNSGGERQRVDVAVALALHALARQRTGVPVEFAVFDEVFERVDEVGCEAIISLLRAEQEALGTIFVITHNPALVERFPGVIEVEKRGGVSRIARPPCGESKPSSNTTSAAA